MVYNGTWSMRSMGMELELHPFLTENVNAHSSMSTKYEHVNEVWACHFWLSGKLVTWPGIMQFLQLSSNLGTLIVRLIFILLIIPHKLVHEILGETTLLTLISDTISTSRKIVEITSWEAYQIIWVVMIPKT